MDLTYQEINYNDIRWVDLKVNKNNGEPYSPSAAYYEVRGHDNQNVVIPKTLATINNNKVSAKITQTVTASAGDYDIVWEIHKEGNTNYHCTRLLVNEC